MKKKELELKGDQVGLLYMEHNNNSDPRNRFKDNKLALLGLDTQDKSKEAGQRILRRVGDIHDIADEAKLALVKQNE